MRVTDGFAQRTKGALDPVLSIARARQSLQGDCYFRGCMVHGTQYRWVQSLEDPHQQVMPGWRLGCPGLGRLHPEPAMGWQVGCPGQGMLCL